MVEKLYTYRARDREDIEGYGERDRELDICDSWDREQFNGWDRKR